MGKNDTIIRVHVLLRDELKRLKQEIMINIKEQTGYEIDMKDTQTSKVAAAILEKRKSIIISLDKGKKKGTLYTRVN